MEHDQDNDDLTVKELMGNQKNKKSDFFIKLKVWQKISIIFIPIFLIFCIVSSYVFESKKLENDMKDYPSSVATINNIVNNYEKLSINLKYINSKIEDSKIYAYYNNGKCNLEICTDDNGKLNYIIAKDNGITDDEYSSDYLDILNKTTELDTLNLSTELCNDIVDFFNKREKETESFGGHIVVRSSNTFKITSYDKFIDNETVENKVPEETPTKKEHQYWTEGEYKIGTDLDSGEYLLVGMGYFEIRKSANDEIENILANDNFNYTSILKVSNGQYLKVSNAVIYKLDDSPELNTSTEGMFKVGVHIEPGEYKLAADSGNGYYEILSNSTQSMKSIVSNDNFSKNKYIKVKKGQYLKLSRCHIEK